MRNWIKIQKLNTFLWTPIFLALGIALYFTLSHELNLAVLIVCGIVGLCGIIGIKKSAILGLVGFFIFGFGYAGIYTRLHNVPELRHDVHNQEIMGTVQNIEKHNDKLRIYLETEKFGLVRVSTNDAQVKIGDTISGTGGLFKPRAADMPHSFDFARHLYFNGISATGYINDIKTLYTAESAVYNMRLRIKDSVNSFLTNTLVLGYKNALPNGHADIWRNNGVAHLWSISGYHTTLLLGWLTIIFYLVFRSIPYVTRRIPARIPALACAWLLLAGYVALSGFGVATLRAFIMTTFIIIAFMLGRNPLSLRIASMAFIILALINPHFIMTAGFQLSFAAIFGIIWLWQNPDIWTPHNKILKYAYTVVLTTLVASAFTAPFIFLHFDTFPIYGLIGNLIFLPLFAFILMPMVFVGTLCAIIGLNAPIIYAHKIYNQLFHVAEHIANLPISNISIGMIPNAAIILLVLGLACLIFIKNIDTFSNIFARHVNQILCYTLICAALLIIAVRPKPTYYISTDHKLIGAIIDDKLHFNKAHDSGNYFAFNTWKKSNGEELNTENIKIPKESGVYSVSFPKFSIVYLPNFSALSKNISTLCKDDTVKYIVSYFDLETSDCESKIIRGGGVIYQNGKIVYTPSNRYWHNRR